MRGRRGGFHFSGDEYETACCQKFTAVSDAGLEYLLFYAGAGLLPVDRGCKGDQGIGNGVRG